MLIFRSQSILVGAVCNPHGKRSHVYKSEPAEGKEEGM